MDIKQNSKIYLDTSLFIYFFENNPKYISKVENLFEQAINKNVSLISSELLYLELLVFPYKEKNKKIENLYLNIEKYVPSLNLIPVTKKILTTAAKIRAEYNFKSPDAIHLATAKVEGCDQFYGSDKKLKSFNDPKVIVID